MIMTWLIKWREEGHNSKEKEYKTERGLKNKLEPLRKDPSVKKIDIYYKVTYGQQMVLFGGGEDLPY